MWKSGGIHRAVYFYRILKLFRDDHENSENSSDLENKFYCCFYTKVHLIVMNEYTRNIQLKSAILSCWEAKKRREIVISSHYFFGRLQQLNFYLNPCSQSEIFWSLFLSKIYSIICHQKLFRSLLYKNQKLFRDAYHRINRNIQPCI